jgi:plasmid stability protein
METTITVRAGETLREELEKRAAAQGKSLSALVRDILTEAVAASSVGERTASMKGGLSLPRRPREAWRRQLRERNWRP